MNSKSRTKSKKAKNSKKMLEGIADSMSLIIDDYYLWSASVEGNHIIATNERTEKKYRIDITRIEN